jgi:hypothetical protein
VLYRVKVFHNKLALLLLLLLAPDAFEVVFVVVVVEDFLQELRSSLERPFLASLEAVMTSELSEAGVYSWLWWLN